jgi:hypothetical protein
LTVNAKQAAIKRTVKGNSGTSNVGKKDDPKPMDVVKAAANLTGEDVAYNQRYCGIKTRNKMNLQNDEVSFQYIILCLAHFQESIPNAAVYY